MAVGASSKFLRVGRVVEKNNIERNSIVIMYKIRFLKKVWFSVFNFLMAFPEGESFSVFLFIHRWVGLAALLKAFP